MKRYDDQELRDMDLNHLWHPFTQMKEWWEWGPLFIERGEGNYLIDTNGKRYLDGVSSLWANVHGHGKEEILTAIVNQAKRLCHSTLLGLSHPPAAALSKSLAEIAPGHLNWVFYSECGAAAVEIALKMAYQYWKNQGEERRLFVCLEEGYHGDTLGAVSVGGIELFHEVYRPLLFPTIRLPSPYLFWKKTGQSWENVHEAFISECEERIKGKAQEIAAVIVEPMVQGAGGILPFPPKVLSVIGDLCQRYGLILIADEVATGFGRTGTMFACEHESVSPDILCLGKGITGGYLPLAATLTTDKVFNAFFGDYEELKTFYHGHTYTGNPVACAAALANLDLFKKERTIESLAPKIEAIRNCLGSLRSHPKVADIRQKGMMAGVELMEDPKQGRPYPLSKRIGHKVCMAIRRHGVILRNLGDTIVVMPPLSVTVDEIEFLFSGLKKAIEEVVG